MKNIIIVLITLIIVSCKPGLGQRYIVDISVVEVGGTYYICTDVLDTQSEDNKYNVIVRQFEIKAEDATDDLRRLDSMRAYKIADQLNKANRK
jgi:hypothetical protein